MSFKNIAIANKLAIALSLIVAINFVVNGLLWQALGRVDTATSLILNHRILDSVERIRIVIVLGALVFTVAAAAIGWRLFQLMAKPLVDLATTTSRLATDDDGVQVPHSDRDDEIGQLARSLLIFQQNLTARKQLETQAGERLSLAAKAYARDQEERALSALEQQHVFRQLTEGLEKLSKGDLRCRLPDTFAGDYERLRITFNSAVERLQQMVRIIADSAEGIKASSDEVTMAAKGLSYRIERQSGSLEEAASALDQIATSVRETAEGTMLAREVVAKAKLDIEQGDLIVGQTISSIGAIEEASRQIQQIVTSVERITVQANLLAVNASVEASRSGEGGSGFAAVATDLRSLAQQAADTIKEIKAAVSHSDHTVSKGIEQAGAASIALKRIVRHAAKIKIVVGDIAASAQEQAVAFSQINAAVNKVEQMTQQNALAVEECSAHSQLVSDEAKSVTEMISGFRLENDFGRLSRTSFERDIDDIVISKEEQDRPLRHDRRKAPRPPKLVTIVGSLSDRRG